MIILCLTLVNTINIGMVFEFLNFGLDLGESLSIDASLTFTTLLECSSGKNCGVHSQKQAHMVGNVKGYSRLKITIWMIFRSYNAQFFA